MARIKYIYDTETCRYERDTITKSDVLLNLLGFLAVSFIMALGIVIVYNSYFESPEATQLKKENKELAEHFSILQGEMMEVNGVIQALEERDNNIYRKIYEAEPIPAEMRMAGRGGSETYKTILDRGLTDMAIVNNTANKIEKIKRKASIQNQSFDEVMQMARDKDMMLSSLPAIQPIENKELTKLVSGFGMRINPFHKARVKHEGLDFASPRGSKVFASGEGEVIVVKDKSELETGYGNYIEIDHGFGYITKYAHLGLISVKKGDKVSRGDVIAVVGSTGGSIAPHVHYEVIKDGIKIDPINFLMYGLSDKDYKELLKLASRENQSFD